MKKVARKIRVIRELGLSHVGEEILKRSANPYTTEVNNDPVVDDVARLFISVDRQWTPTPEIYRKYVKSGYVDTWVELIKLADYTMWGAWDDWDGDGYNKAESSYWQAVDIIDKVVGLDHPLATIPRNRLARYYICRKETARAERLCRYPKKLVRKFLAPGHLYMSDTFETCATLYLDQDKYDKAEKCGMRLLNIRRKFLRPHHPSIKEALQLLTQICDARDSHNRRRKHKKN